MRFAVALLGLPMLFSGCAAGESSDAVRAEDIPYMVTRDQGAITGDMYYRDGKAVSHFRVRTFNNENDVVCQVETTQDGKFYCAKLWPGSYRVEVNLKDWPDCSMSVMAGRFSNVTIREPTYSAAGMAGGCIKRA